MELEKPFSGLKGGARTKMTARMSYGGKVARKRPAFSKRAAAGFGH